MSQILVRGTQTQGSHSVTHEWKDYVNVLLEYQRHKRKEEIKKEIKALEASQGDHEVTHLLEELKGLVYKDSGGIHENQS
ncbi:MAG: hypothetical protein HRT90_07730 [Candidatus Margulisbacteria bacterium]|nr:hypothetical protein [Candidatus Margulisiibacteriota bacterium]